MPRFPEISVRLRLQLGHVPHRYLSREEVSRFLSVIGRQPMPRRSSLSVGPYFVALWQAVLYFPKQGLSTCSLVARVDLLAE